LNIRILQLIEGAKEARGLTVVIDVFRAFSVEAYLLSMGARAIIPVGDSELAYRLKREHPEMLLAGERHGKIMPGFDMGNSPSEIVPERVKGKVVVHTTSAGTQGIANAVNASEILGGALVNAKATADYIRRSGAEEVSLVCMGLQAEKETEEDTLCAEYIKSLLENKPFDLIPPMEALRYTSGAKFFDPKRNDVFPEADFHMCTKPNLFDFVLKYGAECEGYPAIVKG